MTGMTVQHDSPVMLNCQESVGRGKWHGLFFQRKGTERQGLGTGNLLLGKAQKR